ncbi:MAG TPA: XRE family transcriptional regulator [Ruminococcaceae bacterium]|nr:XRE family transcriptional regulator [Oscillospiraceae bacterium]
MKLSEKIVQLCKSQGLSQEELAERLNLSRQAVSRWESGVSQS